MEEEKNSYYFPTFESELLLAQRNEEGQFPGGFTLSSEEIARRFGELSPEGHTYFIDLMKKIMGEKEEQ